MCSEYESAQENIHADSGCEKSLYNGIPKAKRYLYVPIDEKCQDICGVRNAYIGNK